MMSLPGSFSAPTGYAYDPRTLLHKDPADDHPEKPERVLGILERFESAGLLANCKLIEPNGSYKDPLFSVKNASNPTTVLDLIGETHTKEHVDFVMSLPNDSDACEDMSRGMDSLYLCPESAQSAVAAAQCTALLACQVASGKLSNGFAIVRPPGHHAEPHKAMGFCLFNNVAVAAHTLRQRQLAQRILIVDWDIHHGNGTQAVFEQDPQVLTISIHRYDNGNFYPGNSTAGAPSFVGVGAGKGFSVNVGWNGGGVGDADYLAAFVQIVMPIAREFNPDMVLVSAGFDAANGDPIGQCWVNPPTFARMTHMLKELAHGRVVLVLEGGYDVKVVADCAEQCLRALLGENHWSSWVVSQSSSSARNMMVDQQQQSDDASTMDSKSLRGSLQMNPGPSPSALAAIRATIRAQCPYWKCLRPRFYQSLQIDSNSSSLNAVSFSLADVEHVFWSHLCTSRFRLVTLSQNALCEMDALLSGLPTNSSSPDLNMGSNLSTASSSRISDGSTLASMQSSVVADHGSPQLSLQDSVLASTFAGRVHVSRNLTSRGDISTVRNIIVFAHESGTAVGPGGPVDSNVIDVKHCHVVMPFAGLMQDIITTHPSRSTIDTAASLDNSLAVIDICVPAHKWKLKQNTPSGTAKEINSLNALFIGLWDYMLAPIVAESSTSSNGRSLRRAVANGTDSESEEGSTNSRSGRSPTRKRMQQQSTENGPIQVLFVTCGLPAYSLIHLLDHRALTPHVSGAVVISPTLYLPVASNQVASWYQEHSLVIVPAMRSAGSAIATHASFGRCISSGSDDPAEIDAVIARHQERIVAYAKDCLQHQTLFDTTDRRSARNGR